MTATRAAVRLALRDVIARNVTPGGWIRAGTIVRLEEPGLSVMVGDGDPTSKLTVDGTVESLAGGFRFPDGSVQDRAAVAAARRVDTAFPLLGGGDLGADRALGIATFGPSGPGHGPGVVPDPGAAPGTSRFLREDATWQELEGAAEALIPPARLATLATSPLVLVPAPGPGRALALEGVFLVLAGGTVPHGGFAPDDALVFALEGGAELAHVPCASFLDRTTRELRWLRPDPGAVALVGDAALVLSSTAAAVVPGDAAVRLRVHFRRLATEG